jgi:hypothetical protein
MHRWGCSFENRAGTRDGYLSVALHGWHSVQDVERTAAWLTEARVP